MRNTGMSVTQSGYSNITKGWSGQGYAMSCTLRLGKS